jgi:phage-related protein
MFYMAAPRVDLQAVPFRPGGVAQDTNLDSLRINLDCIVEAVSAAKLKTQMGALKTKLFSRTDQSLRLDFQSDRYWLARLTSKIEGPILGVTNIEFPLTFIAADPIAYSTVETDTEDEAITSSPDTIAVGSAGTSLDETFSEPVWYVRNTTGGGVSSITVNNTTTGESLTWANFINSGFWLKIDSSTMTCYRGQSSTSDATASTYVEAMANVSGIFPRLDTLVENSITVTGLSAGTLRAIYRVRYR